MQSFIKEEWGKEVINKRKGIIVSGLVTFFGGNDENLIMQFISVGLTRKSFSLCLHMAFACCLCVGERESSVSLPLLEVPLD